jgi:hypothetical protein
VTKPIINIAELGLGERAVTISDDSGGWIWLYEVGFLKVKACFWADLHRPVDGQYQEVPTKLEEIGWPFATKHV